MDLVGLGCLLADVGLHLSVWRSTFAVILLWVGTPLLIEKAEREFTGKLASLERLREASFNEHFLGSNLLNPLAWEGGRRD